MITTQPTLILTEAYVWYEVPNTPALQVFFSVNKNFKVFHFLGAAAPIVSPTPSEADEVGFLTVIDSVYRAPAGETIWVMTNRRTGAELQYTNEI